MDVSESKRREAVTSWYFRLNGCFVLPNYLLHREGGGGQLTEFDLLAVRFPYRSEMASSNIPMCDDAMFSASVVPTLFIVECTRGRCKLNNLWRHSDAGKVSDLLDAVGITTHEERNAAVADLLNRHSFDGASCAIKVIAVGSTINSGLNVEQVTWPHTLKFIHRRLNEYKVEKADHSQWDPLGKRLYDTAIEHNERDFLVTWRTNMGLRTSNIRPRQKS